MRGSPSISGCSRMEESPLVAVVLLLLLLLPLLWLTMAEVVMRFGDAESSPPPFMPLFRYA